MMGMERALKAGRGAPAFFQAVRPFLVGLVNQPDFFGYAPKLLAQIDALHATPILMEPGHFTLDNPQLRHVIDALNQAHSPIPHDVLLPLIAQLEPLVERYPRNYEMSAALYAYARNPDARTETKLRAMLQSPVEKVQTGAAEALAALHGLEDIYQKLLNAEHGSVPKVMSEPETHYWQVALYYYEIQNGGPWQYFGNSTGDDHSLIIAGLRAIGAPKTAQVLEEAGKVFGPDGPPRNRDLRNEMLDSLTARQQEIVDQLYSEFPSGENIEMLLFLYAVEHRAEFRNCRLKKGD
jgi:hypothetical protein